MGGTGTVAAPGSTGSELTSNIVSSSLPQTIVAGRPLRGTAVVDLADIAANAFKRKLKIEIRAEPIEDGGTTGTSGPLVTYSFPVAV